MLVIDRKKRRPLSKLSKKFFRGLSTFLLQLRKPQSIILFMYANYPQYVVNRILANSFPLSNGCVEYGGSALKHKYGLVCIIVNGKKKSVPAHRAMFMAMRNQFDLPSSIYIRCKCRNHRCVNIEHLESSATRSSSPVEPKPRATKYKSHTRVKKFTDEQIIAIRNDPRSPRIIAASYHISKGYISKLKSGKAKVLVKTS